MELETDDSNVVDAVSSKRQKKLKEYNYKVSVWKLVNSTLFYIINGIVILNK